MKAAFIHFFIIMTLGLGALNSYANEKVRRAVNLEFEEVPDATSYQIRIIRILKDGEKKAPIYFKVDTPKWSAKVVPGKYLLQMRSYDDRGVPGDWSEESEFWVRIPAPEAIAPKAQAAIKTKEDDNYEVKFKWQAFKSTNNYLLEVSSKDGSITKKEAVSGNEYKMSLPVAKDYTWKVTAIMNEGDMGDSQDEPNAFTLIAKAIEKPEIDKPVSKFVTKLNWSKPERTETFDYALFRKTENKKWKLVKKQMAAKESEMKYDLKQPPGIYRLSVKANANHTESSQTTRLEFEAAGNLRSPAAIEEAILKDSLRKPTAWYAIASYFITSMTYVGQDVASNKSGSFEAIGGNGRIGVGYQKPNHKLGYYGVVDMAGFTVDGQNITFPSLEMHVTYEPWKVKNSQLLLSSGFYTKELPEIIQGSNGQLVGEVNKVSTMGLHGGFKYWRPFTQKLGIQANARFYSALSTTTSRGTGSDMNINYQFGLLGSYRLSQRSMGFAGYAYRDDKATYLVDGQTQTNSVQITGHYLNLILEYSF